MSNKMIVAVFQKQAEANQAVDQLMANGFSVDDISLLMSDKTQEREFAVVSSNKTAEGLATGGSLGGAVGALAGALVAVSAVAIPGIGLMASGPIVAALTGAGAGAIAGGGLGALVGHGIPEHELKIYENEVKEGGILVCVSTEKDRENLTREILKDAGSKDITVTK